MKDHINTISTTTEAHNYYEQGYQDGGSDMEKAKQIIIDGLLKQIEQIRTEVIEEFREKMFSKLCRLTLSMYYFKMFDEALQETYKELKEQL